MNYKIIALDLDGTLLDSNKKLSQANYDAIKKASDAGIEIVPCTGRYYSLMPEVIRNLDFVNYAIIINGAQILDIKNKKMVYDASISVEDSLKVMNFLDTIDCIYDCYMDDQAYISDDHHNRVGEFNLTEHYYNMWLNIRKPVGDLKEFIKKQNKPIQKMQFIFKDPNMNTELLEKVKNKFPYLNVSTSMPFNIEINDTKANKGLAITKLAEYIGCDISQTVGMGDGLNDFDLLKTTGLSVAMANSHQEVLKIADYISEDCDHDGVAKAIDKLILK